MQVLGATQSASVLQVVSHAAELQMKAPHDRDAGVKQAPAPSQVEAGVSEEAVEHTGSLQLSPLAKKAQVPVLHKPVVPQLVCAVAWHFSCGSGAPSATEVQRPSDVGRLHAMHASAHSLLQQTPWAQWPD